MKKFRKQKTRMIRKIIPKTRMISKTRNPKTMILKRKMDSTKTILTKMVLQMNSRRKMRKK